MAERIRHMQATVNEGDSKYYSKYNRRWQYGQQG